MIQFLSGSLMIEAALVGLFFLKFWKKSGDRIFAMFSAAFMLLAVERWILMVTLAKSESQSLIYVFRLCAFMLIIFAVIDKNRRTRDNSSRSAE